MGIMCRLGLHKWKYIKPVYGSETNKRLGICTRAEQRRCYNCAKQQVKKVHKSKTETIITWLTIR